MHASKEYGFHIQHGPSQKDCTHTGPAHTPLAMKGYGAVSLDGIATWAHSSLLWCNCNLIQVTRLDPTGPADTGTIWRIILALPSDFVNHGLQQLASAICSEYSCDYLRRYYIFFSVPRISKWIVKLTCKSLVKSKNFSCSFTVRVPIHCRNDVYSRWLNS